MSDRTKDNVYSFDTATGVVTARDTSTIKSLVSADLKEVFGITGDISDASPLGRFVEWMTLAFSSALRVNVQNSNQFLLSYAAGQQLDALALMRGLERKVDSDGVEETDEALRERVYAAKEVGSGFMSALKIAIDQVSGVNSSMVVENNTNAELTAFGIDALAPHSIFACVDYDTTITTSEDDIAEAIFKNRPCGTGYTRFTGSTYEVEKNVSDAYGNSYKVYFYTPENKSVNLSLKINNRSYSGADIVGDVTSAVNTWFTDRKFKVGETVYATEIEDGVESLVPGVIVLASITNDGGTDDTTFVNATMLEVPASHKAVVGSVSVQVIARG